MIVHVDTSALVDALTGPRRSIEALIALTREGHRLRLSTVVLYEWLRGPRTAAERAPPTPLAEARHALTGQFDYADSWLNLADALASRGRTEDAARLLQTQVRRHPGDYKLWIGLGNFEEMWEDRGFRQSFRNTLVYVGLVAPASVLLGLGLALLIEAGARGRAFFRAVFFLPVVSLTVAMAAAWQYLLHPTIGPLNALLRTLGMTAPPAWLKRLTFARWPTSRNLPMSNSELR